MNEQTLKTMFNSDNECWGTPQDLFDKLDEEFHFTLDPCANNKNHKCDSYFTEEDDDLSKNWGGHTVFVNPPYGKKISDWVRKSYEESKKENTVVVMLLPVRTDTKYFHEYIYHVAREIRFIKGRLKFTDDDGNVKDSAPFPSMIVIF